MRRSNLVSMSLLLPLLSTFLTAHAQSSVDAARKLFTSGEASLPACALCHSLKKAGAAGQIGPDLDDLRPDAARVEKAMKNGIGPMPSYKTLTDAQIKAVASYVAASDGAL